MGGTLLLPTSERPALGAGDVVRGGTDSEHTGGRWLWVNEWVGGWVVGRWVCGVVGFAASSLAAGSSVPALSSSFRLVGRRKESALEGGVRN